MLDLRSLPVAKLRHQLNRSVWVVLLRLRACSLLNLRLQLASVDVWRVADSLREGRRGYLIQLVDKSGLAEIQFSPAQELICATDNRARLHVALVCHFPGN